MAVGWHTPVGSGFQAPGRPWASGLPLAGLGLPEQRCWHSLPDTLLTDAVPGVCRFPRIPVPRLCPHNTPLPRPPS